MKIDTLSRMDNQRMIVDLFSNGAFALTVRYEPAQRALRITHAGVQRLFFYEPDPLFDSRGRLLNEYGLTVGSLQRKGNNRGVIQLNMSRFLFSHDPVQRMFEVQHPAFPEPICWFYGGEADGPQLPADLRRGLLLVLSWAVAVPALQE